MRKLHLLTIVAALALGSTAGFAQAFLGSDNFNAAGPTFNTSVWNTSGQGSYFTQTNGRAELININGAYNVDGGITWPSNANFDVNSHTYDWTATVSATLDYDGTNGTPSLGIFAKPAEGGFFGIMLRGGQPAGATQIFSSYATTSTTSAAHIHAFQGTVGVATTPTIDVSDVLLRLSWDSSAGTLTSAYSFDGGTSYTTSASITVNGSTTGAIPSAGFSLSLYAFSGGVEHVADTMFFDDFSVSATAVPEPSTYAAIFGGLMLGFAVWRKRRVA